MRDTEYVWAQLPLKTTKNTNSRSLKKWKGEMLLPVMIILNAMFYSILEIFL